MTARAMTRDEVDMFRVQIVQAEVRAGLRCPTCLNRACSLEYGDFECRGPRPTPTQERPDE